MPRTRLAIILLIGCMAIASCAEGGKEPTAADESVAPEETETVSTEAGEPYPEAVVAQFVQGCKGSGQPNKYCFCVIDRMQATVSLSEATEALGGGDQQLVAEFFQEHRAEVVEPCLKFAKKT